MVKQNESNSKSNGNRFSNNFLDEDDDWCTDEECEAGQPVVASISTYTDIRMASKLSDVKFKQKLEQLKVPAKH